MAQGAMAAIIEDGCKLEGNITLNGVGRIAGVVNGTIFSNDTVIISEAAVVNADIVADVIMISGIVKGDVKATSRVEIIKPARFEGTITTPSLIVEDGVIFHGTTKMSED